MVLVAGGRFQTPNCCDREPIARSPPFNPSARLINHVAMGICMILNHQNLGLLENLSLASRQDD